MANMKRYLANGLESKGLENLGNSGKVQRKHWCGWWGGRED